MASWTDGADLQIDFPGDYEEHADYSVPPDLNAHGWFMNGDLAERAWHRAQGRATGRSVDLVILGSPTLRMMVESKDPGRPTADAASQADFISSLLVGTLIRDNLVPKYMGSLAGFRGYFSDAHHYAFCSLLGIDALYGVRITKTMLRVHRDRLEREITAQVADFAGVSVLLVDLADWRTSFPEYALSRLSDSGGAG